MQTDSLPVLSLKAGSDQFSREIGASFRQFGFALVCDHGIDPEIIARAWRLTADFFALPEEEKRSYFIEGLSGARGYTPFGTEVAKGAKAHDLKEFWHVGRDLPVGHELSASMPPNIWPTHPSGFRETFSELYA